MSLLGPQPDHLLHLEEVFPEQVPLLRFFDALDGSLVLQLLLQIGYFVRVEAVGHEPEYFLLHVELRLLELQLAGGPKLELALLPLLFPRGGQAGEEGFLLRLQHAPAQVLHPIGLFLQELALRVPRQLLELQYFRTENVESHVEVVLVYQLHVLGF